MGPTMQQGPPAENRDRLGRGAGTLAVLVKPQIPLASASIVGDQLVRLLSHFATRIEVAGSIRRRRPFVGDIELVVVPLMLSERLPATAIQGGLFDQDDPPPTTRQYDALDRVLENHARIGDLFKPRHKSDGSVSSMGPLNKHLVYIPEGLWVDVFSTTPANWGMAMFIRTGPAEWNIKAMARFRELGMAGHVNTGVTGRDGEAIECPNEAKVFQLLEWPYTPPEGRS